ncbi:Usher syndrome type-1G protein homolog [Pollicipes pollicipes]|uniref:Usher syndrome type-1G protein homolog n=1 Tax=Pollicipes pollicipes TaxID=41117 RepID=UPI0018853C1F|nr:Usher syndrome type-1G protein homolog [Pollicipes pollicipes]
MEEDRFHRAARDGYLDLLHEASKRDCNAQDEDGMTPTLWAAHEGHLDALRLIAGRGGDPDKCDNYGNTALHCAAAKGHMNCVSFLVNFGANLWALDNDFHTAKDLAAIRSRDDVLRYLDTVIAKQEALNKKVARSLKEKAVKEAEKRVKEYDKIQKKLDRKAAKEEQRMQLERQKMEQHGGDEAAPAEAPESAPAKTRSIVSTISRGTAGLLGLHKEKPHVSGQTPRFSELTNAGAAANRNRMLPGGVNRRLQQRRNNKFEEQNFTVSDSANGTKSVRSLSGLKRDDQIMYVQKYEEEGSGADGPGKRGKLTDLDFNQSGAAAEQSLFDRPGFGNVAFRRNINSALSQLPEDREVKSGQEDSIGSAGSLTGKQNPWDEEDLPSDDEVEEMNPETSALHLVLTSAGLAEFIPTFTREQIDLAALALLSEADLAELGLPLGPRRKLLKALSDREAALAQPGEITDTPL